MRTLNARLRRKGPAARTGGFTLIEMLVVVGITTILIAMLLPVITQARRVAKNIKCLANLRQLQQAVVLHAQDHQGYGPLCGRTWTSQNAGNATPPPDPAKRRYDYATTGAPLPTFAALRLALGYESFGAGIDIPPVTDPAVQGLFTCPAQDTNDGWYGPSMTIDTSFPSPREYISYARNDEVLGAPIWNTNLPGYNGTDSARPLGNLAKVRHPSDVFLFADTTILSNAGSWWFDVNWVGSYISSVANKPHTTCGDFYTLTVQLGHFNNGQGQPDMYRHNGALNFVFVDGHAETVQCHFPQNPTAVDHAYNANILSRIGLANGIYD